MFDLSTLMFIFSFDSFVSLRDTLLSSILSFDFFCLLVEFSFSKGIFDKLFSVNTSLIFTLLPISSDLSIFCKFEIEFSIFIFIELSVLLFDSISIQFSKLSFFKSIN